jgi:hypothetical protein
METAIANVRPGEITSIFSALRLVPDVWSVPGVLVRGQLVRGQQLVLSAPYVEGTSGIPDAPAH